MTKPNTKRVRALINGQWVEFASIIEAAAALGLSPEAARKRFASGSPGCRYAGETEAHQRTRRERYKAEAKARRIRQKLLRPKSPPTPERLLAKEAKRIGTLPAALYAQ